MPTRVDDVTPSSRPLVIIAILGVALSVALTIFGFPEATASQQLSLELSALPLSVSLAAGNLFLLGRAQRTPAKKTRAFLIGSGALSGFGLVLMLLAYLTGPRSMVQFGQFLVFVGLLVVLLIAIALQRHANDEWFHLEPVDDEDPESARLPNIGRLPEATDPDRQPSL